MRKEMEDSDGARAIVQPLWKISETK
jgi:hypothetical protein